MTRVPKSIRRTTGRRTTTAFGYIVLGLICQAARAGSASPTIITFENLPDSTILTTQYTAQYGITFTNTAIINTQVLSAQISLNEIEFPPNSGTNVATDNGGPMTITFASPVASVGGYFTYGEGGTQNFTHLIIQAYDAHNNLLATTTSAFNNNEALSGDPGSTPNTFLQVAAAAGISSITITGDSNGNSFALDDLTITPIAAIPAVTSVTPATGAQGQQNLTIAIAGQLTHWTQGTTTAAFGSGITVKSLTINSATSATAVINIDPAATAGTRTVALTTGTEVDSLANGFAIAPSADLIITSSHTGSFMRGENGATYNITVSNTGLASISGQVTMTDTLPTGLAPVAIAGAGWTCPTGALTNPVICTRTDALAAGASYPSLTLTVSVATNAAASVTNTAVVSGGGEINTSNDTATDLTVTIPGSCAPAPTGLISWYAGDAITADLLGANNPTASSAITYLPAEVSTGFSIGTSGYIDIPASPTLANQQFTWSAWALPNGPGPNNDANGSNIFTEDIDNLNTLALSWRATDNHFLFFFGSATSELITSQDAFAPAQFYLVTATYDGTTFKLFVNGVLEGQFAETKTIAYSANTWTIGAASANIRAQGVLRTWNGVIDEVQAFNRALAPTEIQTIYTLGSIGECKSPAIISAVTPSNAPQGQQNVSVALTGNFTHWTQSTTSASFGAGITVASLTVNAATSATAIVNVAPAATPGTTNIILTTGTEIETLTNGFTVTTGTPVLISAAPNTGQQRQQGLSIALSGQSTNWIQGTTTASFGAGIAVASLTVNSPTTGTALVNIAPNAAIGTRTIALTTGTEIDTLTSGFAVRPGTPMLISASPGTGQQGQQNLSVALTGLFTNWIQSTTTATFGAGITVTGLTVTSPTTATASLSIAQTAATGIRTITLTTGAEVDVLANGFAVTSGTPVLLTASPNTGQQGQQNLSVALTGQYTAWQQGTTAANFGAGITVASLAVNSPTTATAIVNISAAAATGTRTITLSTGGEIDTLTNGFTITPGTPALISAGPNTGQQGQQSLSVVLTGQFTAWQQGTTTATFGAGITVTTLTINSPTTATATINIDPAAATGPRTITLTTATEIDTLTNGFTITPGTPVFLSANPATGQQGQQNLSVSLIGQYTTWAQGTTVANFGAGITVTTFTVNSPTSAAAVVNIDPATATGQRNIILSTGAKTDTLTNGFTVTPGTPALLSVVPNTAIQGQQLPVAVTLTGQYTHWVQGTTTASFGAGITASSLDVNSATNATTSLSIAANAAIGPRTVTVTTGSEILMLPNGFMINPPPDLTITKSHTGTFTQGDAGDTYGIVVTNSGSGPTAAPVTMTDTLPTGLTATAIAGTNWACVLATLTCSRSDVLAAGASYPPITLTVSVAANAQASVTNTATVSGGAELNTANDTATDVTTIVPLILTPTVTLLSSKSALPGTTWNLTVSGSKLGSPTMFSFLPAAAPPIAIQLNSASADSSTASLTLTIPTGATIGTFALIATNLSGNSANSITPANRFTVVSPTSTADTDGDGYADVIEGFYGTDPLDPLSFPTIGLLTEVESTPFSTLNAPVYNSGITEVESLFSVLNAPVYNSGVTEVESLFSVLNEPVYNSGVTEVETLFSVLNAPVSASGISETESVVFGVKNNATGHAIVSQATNPEEHAARAALPQTIDPLIDTDSDGVPDWLEILMGTDPRSRDTDGDGLTDFEEIFIHHTNPLDLDTDGDGFSDGVEILFGSDPLNPNSTPLNKRSRNPVAPANRLKGNEHGHLQKPSLWKVWRAGLAVRHTAALFSLRSSAGNHIQ